MVKNENKKLGINNLNNIVIKEAIIF